MPIQYRQDKNNFQTLHIPASQSRSRSNSVSGKRSRRNSLAAATSEDVPSPSVLNQVFNTEEKSDKKLENNIKIPDITIQQHEET